MSQHLHISSFIMIQTDQITEGLLSSNNHQTILGLNLDQVGLKTLKTPHGVRQIPVGLVSRYLSWFIHGIALQTMPLLWLLLWLLFIICTKNGIHYENDIMTWLFTDLKRYYAQTPSKKLQSLLWIYIKIKATVCYNVISQNVLSHTKSYRYIFNVNKYKMSDLLELSPPV